MTEETHRDGTTRSEQPSVLIVDDESDLADTYAAYLADSFDVSVVYGGQEAFDVLDDTVDVVLLDRRMPVVSGNEVLAHIEDRGLDLRVALVTAVDPDFEIIDLQIDDYLVKPVSKGDVRETVERLLALSEYDQQMRKLTSKKLKRNVLEIEKTRPELAESEEFARLNEEIAALETTVDAIERELDIGNVDR